MKRIIILVTICIVLFSVSAFAASSIVAIKPLYESSDKQQIVIALACTAHTDGTFDSKTIDSTDVGMSYWEKGYYMYEVWAINPASTYPTAAAAVTAVDADGTQLIQTGELALSTSASGVAEASLGKYRAVTSKITLSIGDTGSAANTFTLLIKLAR